MKVILRDYGVGMNTVDRQEARARASDMTRTRGTGRVPSPPRDIQVQSAPRGLYVTWALPAGYSADIQRWRVYKDTEANLYAEIADRGTRQCFVEATAGATPPVTAIFVSSLNQLGIESAKVRATGTASIESGAPSMPSAPPGYDSGSGADTSTGYQGPQSFGGNSRFNQ